MLRSALLRISRSEKIKKLVTTAPVTAGVVERFIAGESSDEVVTVTRRLIGARLLVSIDHLGEDTTDPAHADSVVVAYLDLLTKLREAGLSASAEVSIKLTALGQHLRDGPQLALENAELICNAARRANTAVTLDMEDHLTTDSTLEILHTLRKDAAGVPVPNRRRLQGPGCSRIEGTALQRGVRGAPERGIPRSPGGR
jgi:proline dehydrogenase